MSRMGGGCLPAIDGGRHGSLGILGLLDRAASTTESDTGGLDTGLE